VLAELMDLLGTIIGDNPSMKVFNKLGSVPLALPSIASTKLNAKFENVTLNDEGNGTLGHPQALPPQQHAIPTP
jgi:hypothetical protein